MHGRRRHAARALATRLCQSCSLSFGSFLGHAVDVGVAGDSAQPKMAQFVTSWLNTDVGLSREVGHLERDFASGYLFAELIFKAFGEEILPLEELQGRFDNAVRQSPDCDKLQKTLAQVKKKKAQSKTSICQMIL